MLVDDGHHLHVRGVDATPPHGGLQKFNCKEREERDGRHSHTHKILTPRAPVGAK